jgi:GNAT superfamily N-acetyltransferase
MDAELGRRQCEDQPALAVIHGRKAEHVAEERASGLRILGVDESVHAADHGAALYRAENALIEIRELTPSDQPFLREMLYTALFWRGGWRRLPRRLTLRLRPVAMYHRGWGRAGDTGFVAELDGSPVGAVWYRFFSPEEHGDGYVDPETPELAIAVVANQRGRGLGRRLMETIHERARRDSVRRISLSVNADNPAKRLYAALGYREYVPADGKGRMVLELD